jgi:hypothetical protein
VGWLIWFHCLKLSIVNLECVQSVNLKSISGNLIIVAVLEKPIIKNVLIVCLLFLMMIRGANCLSAVIEYAKVGFYCSFCHAKIRKGDRVVVVAGRDFSKRYHVECFGAVR